ncbi:MAG: hypothetical protein HY052_05205 [Proteobacteria bacterium]|nr:hypothetical protein [Pseudomonadota bacterium]
MPRYTYRKLIFILLMASLMILAGESGVARAQFAITDQAVTKVLPTGGAPTTVNAGAAVPDCRVVANNNPSAILVPLGSSVEWQSFQTGAQNVTINLCSACTLPWGGSLDNGATTAGYLSGNGN